MQLGSSNFYKQFEQGNFSVVWAENESTTSCKGIRQVKLFGNIIFLSYIDYFCSCTNVV